MKDFITKLSVSYLFKPGSRRLSILTIFTSLGIGIGTAVVIIVLSVMNGFQDELKNRILGAIPQLTIEKPGGFNDIAAAQTIIKENSNVTATQAFFLTQSILCFVIKKSSHENQICELFIKNLIIVLRQ